MNLKKLDLAMVKLSYLPEYNCHICGLVMKIKGGSIIDIQKNHIKVCKEMADYKIVRRELYLRIAYSEIIVPTNTPRPNKIIHKIVARKYRQFFPREVLI